MGTEFIPIYFVILAAGIILVVRKQEINRQQALYEEQAQKRGGTCQKGGLLFYPKLILPFDEQDVKIYMRPASRSSPAYTFIKTRVTFLRPYRMRIYREIRLFGFGTVFGQDFRIGDSEFDDAFVVQGSDEMVVRTFLHYQIQRSLLGIKAWNPQMEIKNERFDFQVRRELKNSGELDAFIEVGLELLKRIKEMG
ncbi:MAG: hypothetical protein WC450_04120 [Candidatus Omnitrophota bacterium]|jgi:hypothetical protein